MFVCIHKPIIKYTIFIKRNQWYFGNCIKTDLTADFYANKIEIRGNEKKRGK